MKFLLKYPRSKKGKHFHLILYGSFLVLVFDLGGWIGKHINNKRFTLLKNSTLFRSRIFVFTETNTLFSFDVGKDDFNSRSNSFKEGGDDEDQLRSTDLEEEHGFDGPIIIACAKQMVNKGQSKM